MTPFYLEARTTEALLLGSLARRLLSALGRVSEVAQAFLTNGSPSLRTGGSEARQTPRVF